MNVRRRSAGSYRNGVLSLRKTDGGTAQRHTFKIFALTVFWVALPIGTKLEGPMLVARNRGGLTIAPTSASPPARSMTLFLVRHHLKITAAGCRARFYVKRGKVDFC